MKSYNHYCAVAKALDAVGDRWTLLIIRELVSQGPCRYTDLMNGLPGIATNLLADRLASLEEAGIVWREAAPPPVAATLYHLTDVGADLEPVLDTLGMWGVRFMSEKDEGDQIPQSLVQASCLDVSKRPRPRWASGLHTAQPAGLPGRHPGLPRRNPNATWQS